MEAFVKHEDSGLTQDTEASLLTCTECYYLTEGRLMNFKLFTVLPMLESPPEVRFGGQMSHPSTV